MEMCINEFVWFLAAVSLSVLGICLDAFAQVIQKASISWDLCMARYLKLQLVPGLDINTEPDCSSLFMARLFAILVVVVHVFVNDKRLETLISLGVFLCYPAVSSIRVNPYA